MKENKIGLRTLQRIKKAEEDIRRDAANILPSRKRKRTGRFEDIDVAMEKWFSAVQARKHIVTGPLTSDIPNITLQSCLPYFFIRKVIFA